MIDSNEIKKKVPKNLQNKVEFGNLLSLIGNNKIKTIKKLHEHLDSEIEACRIWLSKNKEIGGINSIRREYTRKLGTLNKIKEIANYLR